MNLTCTICLKKKTKKDYNLRTNGSRHRQCKKCLYKREKDRELKDPKKKEYRRMNKDYQKKYNKEYRLKNKKKHSDRINDWEKKKRKKEKESVGDWYVKKTFKLTKDSFHLIPQYRNIILTNRLIKQIKQL